MFDLINKFREIQGRMKEAQENLANVVIEAEAGAGLVKVKVNGQKKLISLIIDEELYHPGEKEMLKDLIIAAVNKAMAEAEVAAKEMIKKSVGDVLPNIPGLDLSNYM